MNTLSLAGTRPAPVAALPSFAPVQPEPAASPCPEVVPPAPPVPARPVPGAQHHVPAFSFERVLKALRARFLVGLTATPRGRADSLLLALEALSLWLILRGDTWKSAALAGLAIALAFFSKQTASIIGVGLGLGLLVVNWRRGLVYQQRTTKMAASACAGTSCARHWPMTGSASSTTEMSASTSSGRGQTAPRRWSLRRLP